MLTARITASGRAPVDVSHLMSARGDHGFLRARALSDSTILITASGDVDAASAATLHDGIERHLAGRCQMVLDFSHLDFFGTAGFSVLKWVDERCHRTGIDWVLVPGPEVARLLRICDPDGTLTTAPNIVSAVAALSRLPHRTPQLRAVGR
jgi:anti-anti-sigma factor